jgi:antitoxin VapB
LKLPKIQPTEKEKIMTETAKLATDGTNQLVILPENFQISGTEVYIKKMGDAIVLISKDNPWQPLFDSLDLFSEDFMADRNQPPTQARETF